MTEEKFMKMLMATRIEMLLERAGIEKKDKSLEEYDVMLDGLDEDKKRQLEAHMDQMANQEAAMGKALYREGLHNGIRLMAKIIKIANGEP